MVKFKRITFMFLFASLFFVITDPTSADANTHTSRYYSGTISHWSVSTGTTVTDFRYALDVEHSYTGRTTVHYSGHWYNYYTPRFMDFNFSYTGASSFEYREFPSGRLFGSIGIFSWPTRNKYQYLTQGSPWRSGSGGNSNTFTTNALERGHLTARFFVRCTTNGTTFNCGQREFTITY